MGRNGESLSHGQVTVVIGGQYGSEGKGNVIGRVADQFDVHVRTGGPNAGHSIQYKNVIYKMRSIPCGWMNPEAQLYIGPGAIVDLELLAHEFAIVNEVAPGLASRLVLSPKASVLSKADREEEGGVTGDMHREIGSTGEGVGACRINRILRGSGNGFQTLEMAGDTILSGDLRVKDLFPQNPTTWLPTKWRQGKRILLEGTQGFGLSLTHGPWPYVTSADTTAAQLVADAGLSPRTVDQVWMVIRTYPIRVAGNSGPMVDEIRWSDLSSRLGQDIEERTTVTNKVRRVGRWDEALVADAVAVNRPDMIILNFADYIDPDVKDCVSFGRLREYPMVRSFMDYIEARFEVPVGAVGVGGPDWRVLWR